VILDIDASLVEIHTESKEGTGPHYKGGWGFHPMFCFADATGEALSGLLRPGNAGANTVADHLLVLDAAVAQLPAAIALGHHVGDDESLVARELVVRTDSAGCTQGFVWGCRARNIGFFVVARSKCPGPQRDLRHRGSRRDLGAGSSPRREPARGRWPI
jgi:hypothetical protein